MVLLIVAAPAPPDTIVHMSTILGSHPCPPSRGWIVPCIYFYCTCTLNPILVPQPSITNLQIFCVPFYARWLTFCGFMFPLFSIQYWPILVLRTRPWQLPMWRVKLVLNPNLAHCCLSINAPLSLHRSHSFHSQYSNELRVLTRTNLLARVNTEPAQHSP